MTGKVPALQKLIVLGSQVMKSLTCQTIRVEKNFLAKMTFKL